MHCTVILIFRLSALAISHRINGGQGLMTVKIAVFVPCSHLRVGNLAPCVPAAGRPLFQIVFLLLLVFVVVNLFSHRLVIVSVAFVMVFFVVMFCALGSSS
jgi:hypothetical protein